MLGAVVLEDPPDVLGPRDQEQVAEEDRDPDQALDEVLDEAVVDLRGGDAGDQERQEEEDADAGQERHAEHQRDRTLAELDAFGALLTAARRRDRRAADEPAGTDEQGLVQDDEAADERDLRPARAVEARVEPLGGEDDPAVGVAEGDGDRIAAAHQDALDQGLAAVRVAWHPGSLAGDGDGPGRTVLRAWVQERVRVLRARVQGRARSASPGARPTRAPTRRPPGAHPGARCVGREVATAPHRRRAVVSVGRNVPANENAGRDGPPGQRPQPSPALVGRNRRRTLEPPGSRERQTTGVVPGASRAGTPGPAAMSVSIRRRAAAT